MFLGINYAFTARKATAHFRLNNVRILNVLVLFASQHQFVFFFCSDNLIGKSNLLADLLQDELNQVTRTNSTFWTRIDKGTAVSLNWTVIARITKINIVLQFCSMSFCWFRSVLALFIKFMRFSFYADHLNGVSARTIIRRNKIRLNEFGSTPKSALWNAAYALCVKDCDFVLFFVFCGRQNICPG